MILSRKVALAGSIISCLATYLHSVAASATQYSTVSRLATGLWHEIAVDTTGIQEISYADLRAMGFDNPAAVNVYGYGQWRLFPDNFSTPKPDDLPQLITLHYGNRLLFYGETAASTSLSADSVATRTLSTFSFESRYFLSDIPAQRDITGTLHSYPTTGNPVDQHTAIIYIENERINPSGLGTGWYDNPIDAATPATYELLLDGNTGRWKPRLFVNTIGIDAGQATLSVTASNVTRTSVMAKSSYPVYTLTDMRLPASTSLHHINVSIATSTTSGFVAPDWIIATYPRNNSLTSQSQIEMFISNREAGRPITAEPSAEVWDVTDVTDQRRMRVFASTFSFDKGTEPWRRFVMFNPSARHHSPRLLDKIPNQNLHASSTPEMLVVAATELFDESQRMVSIHSDLDVSVVDAKQIWREFGSGVPSAPALRRYIKMLYDRNPERLRYVALIGSMTQDNRGITRYAGLLPSYECDIDTYMHDKALSYWSNTYFGALADNYNPGIPFFAKPIVAVGQIPAADTTQLTTYLNKLETLLDPQSMSLRTHHDVVLVNDFGDDALYTQQADVHYKALTDNLDNPVVHKIYTDFYTPVADDFELARRDWADAMCKYPSYMLYIGHAEYNYITSTPHWLQSFHLHSMKFPTLPVMVLSTCRTTAADLFDSTIGGDLLFAPDCGAATVIGNSRFSLSSYNQRFATSFTNAWIESAGTSSRVGDLWLQAINNSLATYTANINGAINTQKYVLFGDPALPLPTDNATISANIDDTTVTPLSGQTLSGTTSFNSGYVTLTAYPDSAAKFLTGRVDTNFRGTPIACNDTKLWSTTAKITDGRFSAQLYIPAVATDQQPETPFHIIARACSDDGKATARTSIAGLTLHHTPSPTIAGYIPLSIQSMDIADITSDGIAPRDITINAVIDNGTTGIANITGNLKAPIEIRLDDKLLHGAETTYSSDNTTAISIRINNINDGHHTVTLSATDNCGTSDSTSVSFTVIDRSLTVTLTSDSVVTGDSLDINIDTEENLDENRLIITDAAGQTVLSREIPASTWTWNLSDNSGRRVASGHYRLQLLSRAGNRYAASAPVTVAVL